MRKQLIRAIAIGVGLALIVTSSALAEPKVVRVGNLVFKDNGFITPSKLPRHEQAPISAILNGQIGTVDGSHPPAIEGVVADFDKSIQINAKGLPVCTEAQLVARSSVDVKKACPDAIVGSGKGRSRSRSPNRRRWRRRARSCSSTVAFTVAPRSCSSTPTSTSRRRPP